MTPGGPGPGPGRGADPAASHALMKRINRVRVLDAIRRDPAPTRAGLAEVLSLDRKSITNFVDAFLAEGLVEEVRRAQAVRGRPRTILRLGEWRAMGLDIGPGGVEGVLVDLYGAVRESFGVPRRLGRDLGAIRSDVLAVHARLRGKAGRFLGTGVSVLGIVDPVGGRVTEAVHLPVLRGRRLGGLFPGIGPLAGIRSSNAKALAEKWFGLGLDAPTFVCVELAAGVGAGIVHERRLFLGSGGKAGELGHVCVEPGGRPCACGRKGCLEAYVGAEALRREIAAATGRPPRNLAGGRPDEAVRRILRAAGGRLGLGMAAMVNILSPTLIILHGEGFGGMDGLLPALRRELAAHCLPGQTAGLDIRVSGLEHAAARGAASLVLSDVFEEPGHHST